MKLIVGLGNPGDNYRLTKHNFGFWIIDKLVEQRSLKYKLGKGDYIFALNNDCIFLKPTSFMNNSGIAINQAINYYKNIDDIIVIYDDIDLDLGKIRFRANGSDGGHNGLKSINISLKSSNYSRLRFGIDNNFRTGYQSEYVLGEFSKEEQKELENNIELSSEIALNFCHIGVDRTMNKYN